MPCRPIRSVADMPASRAPTRQQANRRSAAIIAILGLSALFGLTACDGSSTASPTNFPTGPTIATPPPSGSAAAPTSATSASPVPVATESNPPGDIPDNQAYVAFTPVGGPYRVSVPEGWARTVKGSDATFMDKLNSIHVAVKPAAVAPSFASVSTVDVTALAASVSKFQLIKVTTFARPGGTGFLVTYLMDSAPDSVTNKVVRDAVERYAYWKSGQESVVTLTAPQGSDNVDPWRKVTDSFRWSK